jgi:hypothetical protein
MVGTDLASSVTESDTERKKGVVLPPCGVDNVGKDTAYVHIPFSHFSSPESSRPSYTNCIPFYTNFDILGT